RGPGREAWPDQSIYCTRCPGSRIPSDFKSSQRPLDPCLIAVLGGAGATGGTAEIRN
ncbi:hypothetical protein LEMLEM_LOCUS15291, partial [Lemmus lemmus]